MAARAKRKVVAAPVVEPRLTERATDGWLNEYLPAETRQRLAVDTARLNRAIERVTREQAARAIVGTEGEAAKDRPFRMVQTIQAGITARQYEDQHLVDRMWNRAQLTDRQHEAAVRLLEMATAAGLVPSQEPAWTPRQPSDRPAWQDVDTDDPDAEDRWHHLLRSLPAPTAALLTGLVKEQHPGVRWLASLQSGLDLLADRWRIAKRV